MAQSVKTHFSKTVRRMLGLGLDFWNSVMIASLLVGSVAALVVFISTFAVIRLQKAEAQVASERVAELESATERARLATEAAKERVAGLERDVAAARSAQLEVGIKLAQQQERAAVVEKSLLELKEEVKPRHLSAKQSAQIKSVLERAPPHSVGVIVFIGTDDGIPFSLELMAAINSAGWTATHKGQTTLGGSIRGVAILVKDTKHVPAWALQFQQALEAAGIKTSAWDDPTLANGELVLFIAPKGP